MFYLIYKITNRLNQKIYIGKHKTKNVDDGYMGSGKLIKLAVKKYGVKNFKKEILFYCKNEEQMNQKEKEIVNKNFIKKDDNYNLTLGGDGGWSHCCGKNHNNLHNHRRIGFLQYLDKGIKVNQIWYNNLSDNEKLILHEKMTRSLKKYIKENGFWWKGKRHKESTKKKIGQKNAISQNGVLNSSYGTCWIYNLELKENKKIKKDNLEQWLEKGWEKGRVMNFFQLKQKIEKKKNISNKKQQSTLQREKIYNEMYDYYNKYGFEEFVKKYEYKKTKSNLVMLFKKYVKNFIPQNGKKRGYSLVLERVNRADC